jgi:carbamoyltransferase
MNILGISAGFHDAAISVVDQHGEILFAGHSERYSKLKNDPDLSLKLLHEVTGLRISHIAYYERPWAKQLRQLYSGQGIEWNKLTTKQILVNQIGKEVKSFPSENISSHNHHLSHAAAGFQTSTFDKATVVVIDAIGEWDTISIWGAHYIDGKATYHRIWRQRYPQSIGLFYSAMTKRVGLKPGEDEYILMGMSAYGQDNISGFIKKDLIDSKANLHNGVPDDYMSEFRNEDLAASTQSVAEMLICSVMERARNFGWSRNLVYGGGVALNCVANRKLGDYFENIWIMPCPGDAGSSLGAAALAFGRRVNFRSAYLGHNIHGAYPVNGALAGLTTRQIVGVANGRAEFGPRALGNRSLFADPRGGKIKETVNDIKQRQQFRPFSPVILEELVTDYFDMPCGWNNSRYMAVVAKCRNSDLYPAIVHADGTSRVQTVPKDGSGIRRLLEEWYALTGCPMLLNTSLNIKGLPMVNTEQDAIDWQNHYGITVAIRD